MWVYIISRGIESMEERDIWLRMIKDYISFAIIGIKHSE